MQSKENLENMFTIKCKLYFLMIDKCIFYLKILEKLVLKDKVLAKLFTKKMKQLKNFHNFLRKKLEISGKIEIILKKKKVNLAFISLFLEKIMIVISKALISNKSNLEQKI